MTKSILFLMLFICLVTKAQQKKPAPAFPIIYFSYDNEGNQMERRFEWTTTYTTKNATVEPNKNSVNEDETHSFDAVSYYPNPVKDDLNLEWESRQNNPVLAINVFGFNGKLLESHTTDAKANSLKISFLNHPSGVYAIVLMYSNGKQKSIKIIKQ